MGSVFVIINHYIMVIELKRGQLWVALLAMAGINIILLIMLILSRIRRLSAYRYTKCKNDYFARINHEIRTPLSTIVGLTTITKNDIENKEKMGCWVKRVSLAAMHMLDIVNDVLDLGNSSCKKVKIKNDRINFNDVISDIKLMYYDLALFNNINFEIETDTLISRYLIGDSLRLKQVIFNLISNAIKYNKENGKINLKVSVTNDKIDSQRLMFVIEDSGIGIKRENIKDIFKAYNREDRKETKQITGTGLGLSISYNLVKLMGGELMVDSQIDEGTVFWFELNFRKDKRGFVISNNEKPLSLSGYNILIVDDNEINAFIMNDILSDMGASVYRASNGHDAVEKYLKSSENFFHLILMDVRMPVLNGYEATRIIRKSKRNDSSSIKIIALSANSFDKDIEESLRSGMDSHLIKPLNAMDLRLTLRKVLKI